MSLTGITAYLRPGTLAEAFALLGPGTVPLGGGTDLIHHAPPGTTTLVDLEALPLHYLRNGDGFRIGATTTLTEMLEHPALAAHLGGVVAGMLRQVGSPLLRNAATLGGHLARGRLSDIVPVLLALDATVTLFDGGERSLPLARYYAEEVHRSRHLLTEVSLPAAGRGTAAAFLKFTRTAYDLALLNFASWVRLGRKGEVVDCRVVVGETPALGSPVAAATQVLVGARLDEERIAAAAEAAAGAISFGSDQRAGADYRQALCRVGVRRCLGEVRRRLEGARR